MSIRQTRRSARKASQFIHSVVEKEGGDLRDDDTSKAYSPPGEESGVDISSNGRLSSADSVGKMANTFDCPQCGIKFRDSNLLRLHNKLVHKIDEATPQNGPDASQSKRMRANSPSPRTSGAASPVPQAQSGPTGMECTTCNIKFRSYELLKVHNKLVHKIMMADQPPQNGQISPVIPVDQIKQEKDEARKNAPTIDEGGSLRFDDDDGEHDAPVRDDNSMPPTPPPMDVEQPSPVVQQPAVTQVVQPVIQTAPATNRPQTFECKMCNINFRSQALIKMHNKLVHKITDENSSPGQAASPASQHSPRYAPVQQQSRPMMVQRKSPTPMTNGHQGSQQIRRVSGSYSSNAQGGSGQSSDMYEINKALERAVSTINQKYVSLSREKDMLVGDNERLKRELRTKDAVIMSMKQSTSIQNNGGSDEVMRLKQELMEKSRQIQLLEDKNANIKKALKMMDL